MFACRLQCQICKRWVPFIYSSQHIHNCHQRTWKESTAPSPYDGGWVGNPFHVYVGMNSVEYGS